MFAAKNRALATEGKARASAAQRLKAESRKEGVYIGMTQQEVVNSSWGRPQSKTAPQTNSASASSGFTLAVTICTLKMGC